MRSITLIALEISIFCISIFQPYACLAELKSQRLHRCDFSSNGKGRSLEHFGAVESVLQIYGMKFDSAADIAYHVLPGGIVDVVQVRESDGTPVERYFYEQSVWEAAPLDVFSTLKPSDFFTITFENHASEKSSFKEDGGEQMIGRIHLIPASVLRLFKDMFTLEEISGPANQETFDLKYSHSPLLQIYRSEWAHYLANNRSATKNQIQQKSIELKKILDKLNKGGVAAETLSY